MWEAAMSASHAPRWAGLDGFAAPRARAAPDKKWRASMVPPTQQSINMFTINICGLFEYTYMYIYTNICLFIYRYI